MIAPMLVGLWMMGRMMKDAEGPTRDYLEIQSRMATVAAGWVDLAVFAAFLAVAYGFGDLFAAIQGISHRLFRQHELLERLDAPRNVAELPPATGTPAIAEASIRFDHVSFSYGAREVISDISFDLPAGRCLALVGPSGSGKSTVARLIGRFQDPAAGTIRIGGQDLCEIDPEALHRHLAYVFQDVFLFSGTVAENIALGRGDAGRDRGGGPRGAGA